MDAKVSFAFLLVLFHIALWTIAIAIVVCMASMLIQRFGYTPPIALRAFRSMLAGKRRPNTDFNIITTGAVLRSRWNRQ